MGVSVYPQVLVGFVVTRADFFTKVTSADPTCQKGHFQEPGGPPFCAQDGTKFECRSQQVPTKLFLDLAKLIGVDTDGADWGEELYEHLQEENIFAADASSSGERDASTLIFGKKILRGRDALEGDRGLLTQTAQQLQEAFRKVEQFAHVFGDREVKLYLNSYVSC